MMPRKAPFDPRKLMELAIETMRESVNEPRANLKSRQESQQCVGIHSLFPEIASFLMPRNKWNAHKMKTIKDMPKHARPREKGPKALTDDELVTSSLLPKRLL